MQAGEIYVGECLTRRSNAEDARRQRGCRVSSNEGEGEVSRRCDAERPVQGAVWAANW